MVSLGGQYLNVMFEQVCGNLRYNECYRFFNSNIIQDIKKIKIAMVGKRYFERIPFFSCSQLSSISTTPPYI